MRRAAGPHAVYGRRAGLLPGGEDQTRSGHVPAVPGRVPDELEDAALIDGASHFRTMLTIYVPVSMPAIATMMLFCMVYHWNQWFDGMLYMDNVNLRPLQTFLRQTLIGQDYTFADGDEIAAFADINDRSLRCAQIIIATIPILCSYPFLQRYFVKGIIVGSVKG